MIPAMSDRNSFRRYDLDGAALWFHPASGTHVRCDAPATRHLRRSVPRVVMFGITNACNLACSYCSRDVGRPSTWTVESAGRFLEQLAGEGVLEVAFGGGEPFAFGGFAALLERLHATTALALNVTTNGTLLTESLLRRVGPQLGQVRLSLHDSADWRAAARRLAASPARWGANVIVDDAAVVGLPSLLTELASLGASDVSLLGYVGPDAARHPSAASLARCATIVRESPLPCRVSVCFGRRLGVDRLLADLDGSGDCGAGSDFLTVTPDRRLQACSFQDEALPFVDAADALRRWRAGRGPLSAASPRRGCARQERRERLMGPRGTTGLRVWQAFSGNNSSECHLVARFRDEADAERLLARLTGLPRTEVAPWWELFEREGVAGPYMRYEERHHTYGFEPPESVGVVGRALVAHHDYTLGHMDELAALAWREGAECRTESGGLAFAIRAGDAAEAARLAATPLAPSDSDPSEASVAAHGEFVVGVMSPDYERLAEVRERLERRAGASPLSIEALSCHAGADALHDALTRLDVSVPLRQRLLLSFRGIDSIAAAERFSRTIDDHAFVCFGANVLIDDIGRKRRIALRAHAAGAESTSLEAERVTILTWWSLPRARAGRQGAADPHPLAAVSTKGRAGLDIDRTISAVDARLRPRLRGAARQEFDFEIAHHGWSDLPRSSLTTTEPAVALPMLGALARELDLDTWHRLVEPDHLRLTIQRMLTELRGRRV
jgi:hypothetical protein